jgi:8-oxo-dGTP pyrophosphatase MutT (NUDIX family)
MCTAIREIKEELNLDVRRAERLHTLDFESTYYAHKVSLLVTDQEPKVSSAEILDYVWWHPDSSVSVAPSVRDLWRRIVAAGLTDCCTNGDAHDWGCT